MQFSLVQVIGVITALVPPPAAQAYPQLSVLVVVNAWLKARESTIMSNPAEKTSDAITINASKTTAVLTITTSTSQKIVLRTAN